MNVQGQYQQQYGSTVSQAIPQGWSGQNGPKGESIGGSQRVVADSSHWWLNHHEEEPLPNCNVPVRYCTLAATHPWRRR